MSALSVGTIKSNTSAPPVIQNTSGTEIGTFCRAWVNFNGTGTVAIRSSFNVSSITDNGTGDYTINFTNSMPDANYSLHGLTDILVTTTGNLVYRTASSYRLYSRNSSFSLADYTDVSVSFFR